MKLANLFQRSPVFVMVSAMLLSGCVSTLVQTPITDPGKRLEFEKFSLLPPQGDNWFIVQSKSAQDNVLVVLVKQLDPATPTGVRSFQPHSVRAQIRSSGTGSESVGSPREFLEMIKQSEKANTSARFTVVKESYAPYEKLGDYCVILDKLTEDRGVPGDRGTVYLFHYNPLFCWDQDSRIMVVVGCSQRAPNMQDMIDLKSECEPFRDSLRFTRQ